MGTLLLLLWENAPSGSLQSTESCSLSRQRDALTARHVVVVFTISWELKGLKDSALRFEKLR